MPAPIIAPDDATSRRLAAAEALVIGLDFDGTLAPIVADPGRAVFSPRARAALAGLARARGTVVGIFTGRALDDIRARVGLPDLCYAGNHGAEMVWGARRFGFAADPEGAAREAALLADLAPGLRALAAGEPGAILEEKGLSFSLHYRDVAPGRQAEFAERAARWLDVQAAPVARGAGKGVIEVRPAGRAGKEAAFRVALEWAAAILGRAPLAVYVGDDINDEAAIGAARDAGGVGVAVGERPSPSATHRLADPGAAAAWLRWLAAARRPPRLP